MPYIKIADPNIIDLSAWHQVINVVNQHSDTLTAITNNFGTVGTGTLDWTGSFANEYNVGNQKILYGKAKADLTYVDASGQFYYGTVSYVDSISGTTVFSSTPVVTATIFTGNSSTVSSTNADLTLHVYNVNQNTFNYRMYHNKYNTNMPAPSGTVYINWMAIGPR